MRRLIILALLTASTSAFAENQSLHCQSVIDVENGEVLGPTRIQIANDRITAVESAMRPEAGDIELQTCLPGLMDMHVHLTDEIEKNGYIKRFQLSEADYAFKAAENARKTLLAGFTTVRNLGDSYAVTVSLRKAVEDGRVPGPRIVTSAKSLATTGGHADPTNGFAPSLRGDPGPAQGVVNGVADARKAVRARYKEGADMIKITATGGVLSLAKNGQNPQFAMDELNAIVETASEYGMKVAAHAHGKEGMKRAVIAGVASIEHGTYMDEEVMRLMKKNGTYYVPTIMAGVFVGEKAKEDGFFPPVVRPKAMAIGPVIFDTFATAYAEGVPIAFGTDSGVSPHGDNAEEFVHMVAAGMSPMEAIQASTTAAADLLGESDNLGSIRVGKLADIVAVKGNPLEDIALLQSIHFVMKNGVVYKD